MDTTIQNVMKEIDKLWQEEIEFAQALVRFPSTLGNEEGVQIYIKNRLLDMGLKVDVFDINISKINKLPGYSPAEWDYKVSPQVVGVLKSPGRKGKSLVLNGHVDVVPLGTERYWTRDPWGASIEGDKMYGRGSTDMKAGIAAIIYAVKAIKQAGIQLAGDVMVQTVTDEEGGGNGTLACLERGYIGDGCLIPETFGQKILVGTGGIIWLRTIVPGKPSHPMAGLQRVNAFDNALYLIQGLRRLEEEMNTIRHFSCMDLDHPINFTVGKIAAGEWPAMAPDQCVFTTRIGFYPGTSIEAAKQRVMEYMDRVVQEHSYLKDNPPEFAWTGIHCEGLVTNTDNEFIRTLAKVHREVTGSEVETMYSPGSADHRFWPLYYGLPATCYGPNGGNPHAHDEYVELSSIKQVTQVYARFIMDWCGTL